MKRILAMHFRILAGAVLCGLVAAPAAGADLSFKHEIIDQQGPKDPWAKMLGDIDGDGQLDVIIGGRTGPLVWYRFPEWQKTLIVEGGYQTVDGEVADIDNDGDLDVVMGGVLWYENASGKGETWKTHRIAQLRSHDIEVGDLDGDGRLDVVSRDQSGFGHKTGNKVYLFYQTAHDKWTEIVVDVPHGEGLTQADIDRDGDLDLVIGAAWLENPGGVTADWPRHTIGEWHEDTVPAVADLNGDKRPDIVLTRSEGPWWLSWFEQPADPKSDAWEEHGIAKPFDFGHALAVADMDNDGDPDVVTAEMHQSERDRVMVFLNDGKGVAWSPITLSPQGSHALRLGDIGDDGDIDIMGANWSGGYQPIELWLNQTAD